MRRWQFFYVRSRTEEPRAHVARAMRVPTCRSMLAPSKRDVPLRPRQTSTPPSELVYGAPARQDWLLRSASAAGAAVLLGAALAPLFASRRDAPRERVVRRLQQGASLLALSVLADSALEHYRGNFRNRAMFIAPTLAATSLVASTRAAAAPAKPPEKQGARRGAAFASAVVGGLVGAFFHVTNLAKRPGGLVRQPGRINWMNLLHGAPLGAPVALSLAGAFGLLAERVRRSQPVSSRALCAFTSVGLLGTSAEVGLLHFRGAFQNPFMYVPLIVPPAAAAALLVHALAPSAASERASQGLLAATAAVGIAGVGFHAYGIHRNMGGFANWSQMLLQGPPLPAPPSFTGLALAGLGALHVAEVAR